MKHILLGTAAAIAFATSAAADVPERHTGPYLALSGGVHSQSYVEVEDTGLDRIYFRRGPEIAGAAGWSWANGLRAEIEGSYIRVGPSHFRLHDSAGDRDVGGNLNVYRAMVHVAYDYGHQRDWIVQPYVEGGLGATIADVYIGTPMSLNGEDRETAIENGRGRTSVRPTWRVGLGVNLPLSERLSVGTGLRYTATIGTAKINPDKDDGWELEGWSGLIRLQWGL